MQLADDGDDVGRFDGEKVGSAVVGKALGLTDGDADGCNVGTSVFWQHARKLPLGCGQHWPVRPSHFECREQSAKVVGKNEGEELGPFDG